MLDTAVEAQNQKQKMINKKSVFKKFVFNKVLSLDFVRLISLCSSSK